MRPAPLTLAAMIILLPAVAVLAVPAKSRSPSGENRVEVRLQDEPGAIRAAHLLAGTPLRPTLSDAAALSGLPEQPIRTVPSHTVGLRGSPQP